MILNDSVTKGEILLNKKKFEKLLCKIQKEDSLLKQAIIAKKAIKYALNNSTGYFSSDIIENVFLKISEQITPNDLPKKVKKGSVLHIMSKCYHTGGHSRVVERWVAISDTLEKHSIFFTENKHLQYTDQLKKAVDKKSGKIYSPNNNLSDIQKALELQRVASCYEFIVLHTHMHDVVPIIAFGTNKFKRPVIFFNHANHKFWVGVSISDLVAESNSWGKNISLKRRGVKHNIVIGIPMENTKITNNIKAIKKEFNLDCDKRIIISAGSPIKYKPFDNLSFPKVVNEIIKSRDDVIVVIVGFKDKKHFNDYKDLKKYNNRIRFIKPISNRKLLELYSVSDVVMDSFPMSGATSLIDAASLRKPLLHLNCPTGQLNYINNSLAYCVNETTLLEKMNKILDCKEEKEKNIHNIQDRIKKCNLTHDTWNRNLKKMYKQINSDHRIYSFNAKNIYRQPEYIDGFLFSENYSKNLKINIPFLFRLFKIKKGNKRYLEVYFLSFKSPLTIRML